MRQLCYVVQVQFESNGEMVMSRSQLLAAVLLAAYLYLGLPATATLFYELYHVIGIGALYWAYSGFKAAGYFLGAYEYRVPVCLASASRHRAAACLGKKNILDCESEADE